MVPEVFLAVWLRIPLLWDATVHRRFEQTQSFDILRTMQKFNRKKGNMFPEKFMDRLRDGFANPGNQNTVATKFLYGWGATYFGVLRIDLALR